MKRFVLIAISLTLLGCTGAGVQTYVVTDTQLDAMRDAAGITACPDGTTGFATAVTLAQGGGTIAVKCNIGGLLK